MSQAAPGHRDGHTIRVTLHDMTATIEARCPFSPAWDTSEPPDGPMPACRRLHGEDAIYSPSPECLVVDGVRDLGVEILDLPAGASVPVVTESISVAYRWENDGKELFVRPLPERWATSDAEEAWLAAVTPLGLDDLADQEHLTAAVICYLRAADQIAEAAGWSARRLRARAEGLRRCGQPEHADTLTARAERIEADPLSGWPGRDDEGRLQAPKEWPLPRDRWQPHETSQAANILRARELLTAKIHRIEATS